ncbi:MAG: hypothetical protein LBI42_05285 [Chitinispirillales bacterium]|jgi:hypothetical protein|nr:hypothetical protein [Chitinispirillales bacterium]
MTAYEFRASVSGGVITIPAEYRNKISNQVKVIILSEEPENQADNKKVIFKAMKLDTRGFVFNREDANER